ncbi:hypothetical protein EAI_11617 [Harpegnathos saltator]|uniref:DUF4780 domain-containing protein n=1 Tax=Harpegnathos saltator TaxID=610380 RepID=E2C7M5_HARSA|nr:hypothetical protein EAI_11617 [Harpegnathos saltator]
MDKEKDSILLDIDMDSTIEQNSNTLSEDLSAHATKNTDTLGNVRKPKTFGATSPEYLQKLLENSYDEHALEPFEVHFEKISDSRDEEHRKNLSEIGIGKLLNKVVPDLWKFAFNLKNLGTHKFSVTFPDPITANSFVTYLTKLGREIVSDTIWSAYIPDYRVLVKVITRDINSSETKEEILNNMLPPPYWHGTWPKLIDAKFLPGKRLDLKNNDHSNRKNSNILMLTFKNHIQLTAALYMGKKIRGIREKKIR